MQSSTLERLQCVQIPCKGGLAVAEGDLQSGSLACQVCNAKYPILAGVAIVVSEPGQYILDHVKGISQWVGDGEIPKAIRKPYLTAKRTIEKHHIEEDLESERVNALYFMTHYLSAKEVLIGIGSQPMRELIEKYWEQGPFSVVKKWVDQAGGTTTSRVIELGCGVGGLASHLVDSASEYLGVDSSFASIALARALYFKEGKKQKTLGLPSDLLLGPTARSFDLAPLVAQLPRPPVLDFIVGDMEAVPVRSGSFDGSIVLNAIDMMDDPALLPKLQKRLVNQTGFVIQSAPYIWHERVAASLRAKKLPGQTSAQFVESLYIEQGLKIDQRAEEIPWIFFKHRRQVELYSVHAFLSRV